MAARDSRRDSMIKRILMTTASAALLAGVTLTAAPAQAQFGVEIGPGGARVYDGPRDGYRPVIERRERRIVEEDDDDCRIVIERRVNRFGERVTRRTRVCD